MLNAQHIAANGGLLDEETIHQTLVEGLGGKFTGAKVLVLIPDHTRTVPLSQLFRLTVDVLHDARQLDFLVALGTHPALSEDALHRLVGITAEERRTIYRHIGLLNHAWDDPNALVDIGLITREQVQQIAGETWHPSLGGDVPIRINKNVLAYDHIVILGPTFPHEVVGFSGGAKYLFPGISGPEMINVTHWLGALITVLRIIGIKDTPVRDVIHLATKQLTTPVTLVSLVVEQDGLAGIFIGDHLSAWKAAADLSAQKHIIWSERSYDRVLSWAPAMYDELWTGAKAMYKLEPVVADGGELIIYAPHLDTVSHVHGSYIYRAGYHVLDFFLKQWEQYNDIPLGVLAHSTHVRGVGTFESGIERPRIQVTLASKISPEDCATLSLGYQNPVDIDVETWKNREDDGILFVPKAGEYLYRLA